MKRLLTITLIAFVISVSTPSHAEDCTATDMCMLFTNLQDLAETIKLYQSGSEALRFAVNELVVAGKIIKLDKGTRVSVLAKSDPLYQVLHAGRIYYTINLAVACR